MALTLNDNETTVLKACALNMENQGMDFGFTDEVTNEVEGMTKHQISGYIGSLRTKGVFAAFEDHSQDPGSDCNSVQFSLTMEALELVGYDVDNDCWREDSPEPGFGQETVTMVSEEPAESPTLDDAILAEFSTVGAVRQACNGTEIRRVVVFAKISAADIAEIETSKAAVLRTLDGRDADAPFEAVIHRADPETLVIG